MFPPLALHLILHRGCNDVDGCLHAQTVVVLDAGHRVDHRLAHLWRHRAVREPRIELVDEIRRIRRKLIEGREIEDHGRRRTPRRVRIAAWLNRSMSVEVVNICAGGAKMDCPLTTTLKSGW